MPSSSSLRVATFNLLHGRRWPQRGRYRKAALQAAIAGLEVDILGLQEVDHRVIRTGFSNQPRVAAEAMGASQFVFAGAQWLGPGGKMGNVLAVRGSITEAEIIWHPTSFGRERRNTILARVCCTPSQGDPVECTVAVTHLQNYHQEARAGLEMSLDYLLRRPGPHVLLGDLNLSTSTCAPIVERHGLTLLDHIAPDGTTITHDGKRRVDHIILGGMNGEEVEVPKPPISDHAPIVAVLTKSE